MREHTALEIKKVGVVGSGIMGSGIAETCIQAGYDVVLFDIDQKGLEKAVALIVSNLEKWCKKSDMLDKVEFYTEKLYMGSELKILQDVDIVIEAVTERLEVKQSLFSELEKIVSQTTLLASNTSGISISEIASACNNKKRVVGTHFFNPAPIMPLVEVIRGKETDSDFMDVAVAFVDSIGKIAIRAMDVPGFVVNRIITPMLNEAMRTLESGYASKEDIDQAIKLSMRHPMGPLQLSDFIGLDTLLFFMEKTYKETGMEAFKPTNLLKKMVAEGSLGKKSGKGFYDYSKE